MSEYIWAAGCRIAKKTASPQVVGETLDVLQREHGGRLTAPVVVDAARAIDSPLHPIFEWDDVRAAELHREDQARHILASIRVVQPTTDPKEEPRTFHAFVALDVEGAGESQKGYYPLARVLDDHELLKQAIARAAADLRSFEGRYREFQIIAEAARVAREQIEQVATTAA